jgi:hypothetical protein
MRGQGEKQHVAIAVHARADSGQRAGERGA